ncbi:MAG: hypothetical protein ACK5HR_07460 [Mycoplasmatales bacterium]
MKYINYTTQDKIDNVYNIEDYNLQREGKNLRKMKKEIGMLQDNIELDYSYIKKEHHKLGR